MVDAPLALAFTAGMVATVNPCGFAMLPAYLSFFVGSEGDEPSPAAAVARGLAVGAVVSLGFVVLFGIAGAIISWTSLSLPRYSAWITVVIGIVLIVMGIAFALGWEPILKLPHLDRGGHDRSLWSMFLFGISYAIASLSCTIPVFTSVVASTFGSADFVSGVATFLFYALGMGVLLMALTVTLSLARQGLAHRLRRALPYVQRVSGGIMILMGAYLTWYGIFEIRLQTSTPEGSAPVDLVTGWSASISDWINRVDAVRVGLVLALMLVLAVLVALLRSGPTDEEPAAPAESETHASRPPADR